MEHRELADRTPGSDTHLALLGALGSRGCPDPVGGGDVVDELEALGDGRQGLRALPEVELHGAALAEHVGQQCPLLQRLLGDAEGGSQLLPVLGERQLHQLLALKVLHKGIGEQMQRLSPCPETALWCFLRYFLTFPEFFLICPFFPNFFF